MYNLIFIHLIFKKIVFLASSDGLARLWHTESAEIEREYTGHQKAVTALAFVDNIPA